MSETPIMNEIMLEIGSMPGVRLWRNNVGEAVYPGGARVRYGICNPGGSDLIGWIDGRFLAIEVKAPTGRTAKARAEKQQKFIDAVNASGGVAGRARSVDEARALIERARS